MTKDEIGLKTCVLEEGIRQIRLWGRLDMKNALLIDSQFSTAVLSGEVRVIIDLAGVDFLASIGIRLLVANAKALAKRGGFMVLAQPHPVTLKTIQISGIDSIIPVFDCQEKALAHLRQTSL